MVVCDHLVYDAQFFSLMLCSVFSVCVCVCVCVPERRWGGGEGEEVPAFFLLVVTSSH